MAIQITPIYSLKPDLAPVVKPLISPIELMNLKLSG
jgi:NAD kinase